MNLIKLAVKSIKEDLSASNVVNVFGEASQAPIGFSAENKKLPRKKTVCYVERGGEKGDGCLLAKSRIVFKGVDSEKKGDVGHTGSVLCVSLLIMEGKDSIVISGGEGKRGNVWSLGSNKHIATLIGHEQRLSTVVSYVSDKNVPYAITASWDESIRIWNLKDCFSGSKATAECHETSSNNSGDLHTNRILSLAISRPVGADPLLVSGSTDNSIKIWSLPDGLFQYELRDKSNVTYFYCLSCFNFDGAPMVASGCRDNSIKLWKVQKPVQGAGEDYARSTPVSVIDKVPGRVHSMSVIDFSGCGKKKQEQDDDAVADPDRILIALSRDLTIRMFDLTNMFSQKKDAMKLIRTLTGAHTSPITCVSTVMFPAVRDALIVTSSEKGNICVWRYSNGEVMRFFNGHTETCTCVTTAPSPLNLSNDDPVKAASEEMLIITGSGDRSVRSWLYGEEVSLLHRVHTDGLLCLDVFNDLDKNAILVTGCEKGALQGENLLIKECNDTPYPSGWNATGAHLARVRSVKVYNPSDYLEFDGVLKEADADITRPIIVSGGRGKRIRRSSVLDGTQIGKFLEGHDGVVTAIAVFPGIKCPLAKFAAPILPFIVSGSEDNTVRVWNLHDGAHTHTLHKHELDVLAVAVYVPPKSEIKTKKSKSGRTSAAISRQNSSQSMAPAKVETESVLSPDCPIILSVGVDNRLCIWSYKRQFTGILEGDEDGVEESDDEDNDMPLCKCFDGDVHSTHLLHDTVGTTHYNCVSTADGTPHGTVVLAGGGDGEIHMWSLCPPYTKYETLSGHTDEVQCMSIFNSEAQGVIMATGSWDKTIRIWSLDKFEKLRVIEGHRGEVMGVQIFTPEGGDPAIASCSMDMQIRVRYDFISGVPKADYVVEQFMLDSMETDKPTDKYGEVIEYPRINTLFENLDPEAFFQSFYFLFSLALEYNCQSFVVEYLPMTKIGLLKTNVPYLQNHGQKPGSENSKGSLLFHALKNQQYLAVKTIVNCWSSFLSTPPSGDDDLVYRRDAQLDKDDLLLLCEIFPKEFEKLICSLILQPISSHKLPADFKFLYEGHDKDIILSSTSAEAAHDHNKPLFTQMWDWMFSSKDRIQPDIELVASEEIDEVAATHNYLFLPVKNLAHMEMLQAYSQCCEHLDSVDIFDSDAGQLGLNMIWRDGGLKTHSISMTIYLCSLSLSSFSIYSFEYFMENGLVWIAIPLIIVLMVLQIYFLAQECQEFLFNPISYVSDVWNSIDGILIISGLIGNIARLAYWKETLISRAALGIQSIFMWSNVLYFLRAFESTGPLVSMILRISNDMRPFLIVLGLVIVGFAQCFWLLSNKPLPDDDATTTLAFLEEFQLPFATPTGSLLHSFSFMLGGFNPEGFDGIALEDFALFLSAVFMLVSSILLLNLLIALMGDSYADVKEKGLAQWRLEQADLIIEGSTRMSEESRSNSSFVYFRKKTGDVDEDIVKNQFNIESEIKRLRINILDMKSDITKMKEKF